MHDDTVANVFWGIMLIGLPGLITLCWLFQDTGGPWATWEESKTGQRYYAEKRRREAIRAAYKWMREREAAFDAAWRAWKAEYRRKMKS